MVCLYPWRPKWLLGNDPPSTQPPSRKIFAPIICSIFFFGAPTYVHSKWPEYYGGLQHHMTTVKKYAPPLPEPLGPHLRGLASHTKIGVVIPLAPTPRGIRHFTLAGAGGGSHCKQHMCVGSLMWGGVWYEMRTGWSLEMSTQEGAV